MKNKTLLNLEIKKVEYSRRTLSISKQEMEDETPFAQKGPVLVKKRVTLK